MVTSRRAVLEGPEDVSAIFVRADPNGLAFDRTTERLYVADAKTGSVLTIDGAHATSVARIPSGGVIAANRLGGVAVTPDGTIYAARLGYGTVGAIFQIEPDGRVAELGDLPPRYWRVGVAYDASRHSLYTTQYLKVLGSPCEGAIVEIDLASGQATTVLDGFGKPVGVAKLGTTLVVTDAAQDVLHRVELAGGRAIACSRLADGLVRPDSVCPFDEHSVLVTSYDEATRTGALHRVWLDGAVHTVATGNWQPRGVASDGERAFVAARRAGRVLVFRASSS
jgi:sugar lactone lactonase YvrE